MHPNKQFSIEETVNKNIEKHQFPHFRNHKSLIGWCTMNYPKVLQNPKLIPRPEKKDQDEEIRKKEELKYQFQTRTKDMKLGTNFTFKKPFQTYDQYKQPVRNEGLGVPPEGFKSSAMTVTTAGIDVRKKIVEEQNKNQKYSSIYPLSSEISNEKFTEDYSRKIRQIGDIQYEPNYQSEEIRHLKKLPNSVMTEQNLLETMSAETYFINLHNHTWVSNELISKIGYFAVNIKEICLSSTDITDDVLKELSISCINLQGIDISRCKYLTEGGVQVFLEKKSNELRKFFAAHNDQQITDTSIASLRNAADLEQINLSFCYKITNTSIQNFVFSNAQFTQIHFASCKNITDEFVAKMIQNSFKKLTHCDLSLNDQNNFGKKIGQPLGRCNELQELILTGCEQMSDSDIRAIGDMEVKSKPDGFTQMNVLKLGGLKQITDSALTKLLQCCKKITYLELNNMDKLQDGILQNIVTNCPTIQRVTLNFTQQITPEALEEIQKQHPEINFIRTIIEHTSEKDDGLRMPYPHESKLKIKAKKKKKK